MRQLTDSDIEVICSILDGWTGSLTWNALINTVTLRLKRKYTRQALDRHFRIKSAYSLRKKALRGKTGRPEVKSLELQMSLERIDRLKAENERLMAENTQLLEQFARWAYNAHCKGLTEVQLNQPLPPVDRARTKL